MLLINGLGANVSTWASIAEQLAAFQVISFDAPGTGKSKAPLRPYPMSTLATIAHDVLEAVGLTRVDVLGYSLGGAVAQKLAHDHPESVRRIVLAATSCGASGVPGSLPALLAVSTPLRHYTKPAYRLSMRVLGLAPAEHEGGHVAKQLESWHQEPSPSPMGYTLQMTAFTAFNSLPWLHEITAPTLVITGSHDRLMPAANSAILAATLPRARLQVFDRWGHYLLHDASSGAGAAVAEFFAARRFNSSTTWQQAKPVSLDEMQDFIRSSPGTAHPARYASRLIRQASTVRAGAR